MRNNYQMFDPSIRSDANECKTMVIDLRENRKLDATIQSASNVIRAFTDTFDTFFDTLSRQDRVQFSNRLN